jgi:hypothetical protein
LKDSFGKIPFWKIPVLLKIFSVRFLLKESFLKDFIPKDSGFVEKTDSERYPLKDSTPPEKWNETDFPHPFAGMITLYTGYPKRRVKIQMDRLKLWLYLRSPV